MNSLRGAPEKWQGDKCFIWRQHSETPFSWRWTLAAPESCILRPRKASPSTLQQVQNRAEPTQELPTIHKCHHVPPTLSWGLLPPVTLLLPSNKPIWAKTCQNSWGEQKGCKWTSSTMICKNQNYCWQNCLPSTVLQPSDGHLWTSSSRAHRHQREGAGDTGQQRSTKRSGG